MRLCFPGTKATWSLLVLFCSPMWAQQIPRAQQAYDRGVLLEGQGRHAEAGDAFQQAIDINPEFADAYFQLGQSQLRAGNTQAAIRSFIELVQLDPANEKALLAAADAYVGLNLFEDALTIYLRTLPLDPQSTRIHFDLGYVYFQQNLYAQALPELEKAITIDPSNVPAQRLIAAIYEEENKLPDAVRHLRAGVAQNARNANLHVDLGNALHAQGNQEEAELQFRFALAIEPSCVAAHTGLAKLYRKGGQPRRALEESMNALKIDPHDAPALLEKGQAEYALGARAEATRDFEEFIREHPEDAEGEFLFGLINLTADKCSLAADHLARAVQLNPNFDDGHYYLAEALYRCQRTEEAKQALAYCLRISASNPRVMALSAKLNEAQRK
jgi:tetratricopeptide (TPR) repeat protein